jgi:hypothetical protein
VSTLYRVKYSKMQSKCQIGDRSGRGAAIRTASPNVNKKQYRRHIAAMIELYLERRPPRARERRWSEPPLTPGNDGRLTAGWPTGSQLARRAIITPQSSQLPLLCAMSENRTPDLTATTHRDSVDKLGRKLWKATIETRKRK